MNTLHQFLYGIYPYLAASLFLFGSLFRFEREQYSWKSDSSQLLHSGLLRFGSPLFHVGIIGLFFGHLAGLLTPIQVFDALGIPHGAKQMLAMVAGGIMGSITLCGLLMLLLRRFGNARVRATSTWRDQLTLIWILLTLLLGLSTIPLSAQHSDGHMMALFMLWAQHVLTLRGDAASFIVSAPVIFKVHLFMGMSLFALFPFTRLVHVWSGFGSVSYLGRAWQLVRPR